MSPHSDETAQAYNLYHQGQFLDSILLCEKLLVNNPLQIDILYLAALNHQRLQQADHALAYCARILILCPTHSDTLRLQTILLTHQKRYADSIPTFEQLLRIDEHNIDILNDYGLTLAKLGYLDKSLSIFEKALQQDNQQVKTYINKAFILLKMQKYQAAFDTYQKAFLINDQIAEAISDCGNALLGLKRFDEALVYYKKAQTLNPNCAAAHYSESYCRLLLGDLLEGFKQYEWRWSALPHLKRRYLDRPLWTGEANLNGQSIIIYSEQGHGDVIQFCRYLPLLQEKYPGATIYFETYPCLASIMETIIPKTHLLTSDSREKPETQYQCPLLSLPYALQTDFKNIPAETPYLAAGIYTPNTQYSIKTQKRKIGVVWQSNPSNTDMQYRSIDLSSLLNLSNEAHWVILQKDISKQDQAVLDKLDYATYSQFSLHDYSDTARLIAQVDLVIGIDTSVIHLAGAMNKPTWILLSDQADWRWFYNRDDSPWYPSVKLFRQKNPQEGWGHVLNEIALALEHWNLP